MSGVSKLSSIRVLQGDDAAREVIVAAIVKHSGSKQRAAEELGVKKTTMYRIIEELALWDRIDRVCEQHGFRSRAGRPRGPVTEKLRRKIRKGRRAQVEGTARAASAMSPVPAMPASRRPR